MQSSLESGSFESCELLVKNKNKETSDRDNSDNYAVTEDNSENNGSTNKKRKSIVPKLIDNKWQHLARNLSAAQRDKMLLEEAKEDAQFRRELATAMKESNATFNASIQNIGNSILQLSQNISRSIFPSYDSTSKCE